VKKTLVWFRGKDLRISDHPALRTALDEGARQPGTVIPCFVLDPFFFAKELPNRMQFLLESLCALRDNLAHLGSKLVIVAGPSHQKIPELAAQFGADQVFAMRWVEPFARTRDARLANLLPIPFRLFEGETLHVPETIRNGSGSPYGVFTPFSKNFFANVAVEKPLPAPSALPACEVPKSVQLTEIPTLKQLGLHRNERLIVGGERNGKARLATFLSERAAGYAEGRDRMGEELTSRLSADLKFGTLSARTVYYAATKIAEEAKVSRVRFLTELVWREFSHMLLWEYPELLREPFRKDFVGFPWRADAASLKAWKEGQTGYPVVDAAARQLLGEGYVHNRARMVSASFFCKHLLLDYKLGEAHYMKYLVDGDWAQNNAGWQWSAGSGCDAQPYFRVFNPMTQGQKFDPKGDYVRRWVPELANLPSRYIHEPWNAPPLELAAAGVALGKNYPLPIVEHAKARQRFLDVAKTHFAKARA
jgi:deoxyribodipyrimidine photo-lyase